MKKYLLILLLSVDLGLCYGQNKLTFNHGPYIHELTETGVTVIFTTSSNSVSWVDLKTETGEIHKYYQVENGIKRFNNTFFSVRINELLPNTNYSYRINSREVVDFQPYKIQYGDSLSSGWYNIRTINPNAKKLSFLALSDMHTDTAKLANLLKIGGIDSTDLVFYNGDMMNYYDQENQPYDCFIDKSVDVFATRKPFVMTRGNHELRGKLAYDFQRFIPRENHKLYGTYKVGNVIFVILDCGEDKRDNNVELGGDFGYAAFDKYIVEQAEWLKKTVRCKEFLQAKYRIAIGHFPPYNIVGDNEFGTKLESGISRIEKYLLPYLNKAKIDLMISGHKHKFLYLPPSEKSNFPIILNSKQSVTKVDINHNSLKIKVLDTTNSILSEMKLY
jgi:Icc-related predicted phosphoesterase